MIILTCDHPRRELNDLKKIQEILNENNIKCKIINKTLVTKAYNLYRPKIITLPHPVDPMIKQIDQIKNKTLTVLIPTESCIFVDKFIDMLYFNHFKNHKLPSNFNKIDYIFSQSKYTSKYLEKKNKKKGKIIDTGFLYYDYWYKKKHKSSKERKRIGLALTFNFPFRFYKEKEFVKNFYYTNRDFKLLKNNWRLHELNLGLINLSLIFEIVDQLSKKYILEIRPHPLDTQTAWREIYKNNKNVKINFDDNTSSWIDRQDVIISTFSAINIDSYVYKKPHISLVDMIPNNFFNFNAYNSHSYKDYKETSSYKPKNMSELIKIIKNSKFKSNRKMDYNLKKYYNYPLNGPSADKIANNLIKIYNSKQTIKRDIVVYSKYQKNLNSIIGNYFSSLILFYLSEFKIFFNRYNHHNYFSLFTKLSLTLPRKIIGFFKKY